MRTFVFVIFSALFLRCGTGGRFVETPSIYTIVLCDLTHSMDTDAINRIIDHATQLYLDAPNNTTITFIPISNSDHVGPLLNHSFTIKISEMSTAYLDSLDKKEKEKNANNLRSEIRRLFYSFEYVNVENTCITYAIPSTYSKFDRERKRDSSAILNLIILSDMVENCDNKNYRLNLRFTSETSFQNSISKLKDIPDQEENLASIGVNVFFVLESKIWKPGVTYSLMKSAWRDIFYKYGYKDSFSHRLEFYEYEIPTSMLLGNY